MAESERVDVVRVSPAARVTATDVAAVEEPLELRLGGAPFVVIMRTPGADRELAAGFLLSERLVRHPSEIARLRHCTDGDPHDQANVMNVWLAGAAADRAGTSAPRRAVGVGSACGVCGRQSVADLLHGVPRVISRLAVPAQVIATMPGTLRAAQATFAETGGLHAAALFDASGQIVSVAEDVGRHNAVDKVIGGQFLAGRLPLDQMVLFVSGRTSFELVQKAVVAGVPILAAVSAPSSLAIALAREASLTLVGFVRGETCNVYTSPERVT